jgi:hypothetical protein
MVGVVVATGVVASGVVGVVVGAAVVGFTSSGDVVVTGFAESVGVVVGCVGAAR